jgi:PAS domain S-box-containing protein
MKDEEKTKEQLIEELAVLRRRFSQLETFFQEQQQVEEALRQQQAREQLVAEIAQRIRQSLNLEEVLSTTVSEVQQFLQAERVFIYRFQPDWSGVAIIESVDFGCPSILGRKITDTFFAAPIGRELYQQGRIQAVTDIYTAGLSPCHVELLAQLQVRATLIVPILQGENLWGLLVVNQCSRPRQWQQLEIDLLQQLATQLAIALQQSQLYEQTQHQVKREQALNRVIQSIRNSLDLKTIFSTATYEIAQLLQINRVEIVQYLPERQVWLNVTDYRQNPELPDALGLEFPDAGNEIAAQLKRLEIVQIDDASICTDEINNNFAKIYPGAWLHVPLHFGGSVWGSLSLIRNRQTLSWHEEEIELTRTVAAQIAIAIQQSTLFQQVQIELNERKQAEQKILEQAALLDVATDAIIVQDLENKIVFWNKSAERLYGWSAQEALGKKANKLLYKDASKLEEAFFQVNLKGEWYGELSQVQKDGKEIIVETRWSLVRDEQENPKSILIVNTNITQKKQLETQLLRAQRLESLGTLASGIAHDLNNILAPMLMSAQLLQMKISDDRKDQLLKTLEGNAQRGAALVKQVLSFARGVEGKRAILQLGHLILEIQQFANQTFPKSIEFSTDIVPDLSPIFGDATQLHQVLMNLVINARDAMPNGGILSIAAKNFFVDQAYAQMNLEATIGSHVMITIGDTGIGMSSETLDRIFEPFFTTKELGRGTGLGLSTVLGIVKSHNGFIQVSSIPNKGTQFQVFFKAIQQNQTQAAENFELPLGSGELVLVVDDEAEICEITKTTLEKYNYQVMTANDGIDAISLYVQNQDSIAIVLLDMMMPGIDGLTTIRTLQKMNPSVRIITSSGLVESKQLTQVIGITTFLPKPYTIKQLLQTLHSLLVD